MRRGETLRDCGDMGPALRLYKGRPRPGLPPYSLTAPFASARPQPFGDGIDLSGPGTGRLRLTDRHPGKEFPGLGQPGIKPRTLEKLHHQHPRGGEHFRGQIESKFGEGDGPILVRGMNTGQVPL